MSLRLLTLMFLCLSVIVSSWWELHRPDRKVRLVLRELQGRLAHKEEQVLQDPQDPLVILVLQGLLDQLEQWGRLALQELQVQLELPVQPVLVATQAQREQLDLQVASAVRDLLDLLVQRDLLVRQERQELRALQAQQAQQV